MVSGPTMFLHKDTHNESHSSSIVLIRLVGVLRNNAIFCSPFGLYLLVPQLQHVTHGIPAKDNRGYTNSIRTHASINKFLPYYESASEYRSAIAFKSLATKSRISENPPMCCCHSL